MPIADTMNAYELLENAKDAKERGILMCGIDEEGNVFSTQSFTRKDILSHLHKSYLKEHIQEIKE